MKIIKYKNKLFYEDPLPTEQKAYQTLKEDPINKDVTYLAIPWTTLINQGMLNLLEKIRIQLTILKNKKRLKLKNAFTVCQHTNYKSILSLLKRLRVDVLFSPHATNKNLQEIKIESLPHYAVQQVEPAKNKNLLYSFIGMDSTSLINESLRRKIFDMNHPQNTKVIKRKEYHFNNAGKKKNKLEEQYKDVLSRSRFSLCPRGYGVGTTRFWESLKAGAIPILLSDDLKLPPGTDWGQCIVRVSEKKVQEISSILKKIKTEEEEEMRKNCLKAYKKNSGKNFVRNIREYYEK